MRWWVRTTWMSLLFLAVACSDDGGTALDPTPPDDEGPAEPAPGFAVAQVVPSPSAADVDVRDPIVVTFSEDVDSSSVDGALILTSGERAVRGTVALASPTTVRFQPSTPLDPGEELEVTLSSSVRASDGTALDSTVSWTFRTAGEPLDAPDPERLAYLVSVLADDSLRGRGSGSAYEARAAEAIARDLEASGLTPFQGAWLSPFTASTGNVPPQIVHSRNVLGFVPGAGDLAGDWVVVGAHYDHLGFVEGTGGSLSIYHGADDNASGSSLVMEVARLWAGAVSGSDTGPRRSVLFALWGAEERGLLGSCSFVHGEVLPQEVISAVFNFDMVGRLGDAALQVPVEEPDSVWWGALGDANRTGLGLDPTPGCTGCSDHRCFLEEAVPVAWFHTGLHADYHRPTDTADKVDYPGLARITGLVLGTLWRVAVAEGVGG